MNDYEYMKFAFLAEYGDPRFQQNKENGTIDPEEDPDDSRPTAGTSTPRASGSQPGVEPEVQHPERPPRRPDKVNIKVIGGKTGFD